MFPIKRKLHIVIQGSHKGTIYSRLYHDIQPVVIYYHYSVSLSIIRISYIVIRISLLHNVVNHMLTENKNFFTVNAQEYQPRGADRKPEYNKGKTWKPNSKPNPSSYRGGQKEGKFGKVNQIEEEEEEREESNDEGEEWNGEDDGAHFLGEPTL